MRLIQSVQLRPCDGGGTGFSLGTWDLESARGVPRSHHGVTDGEVSYLELFFNLNELWAGERLVLKKAVPGYLRALRPISVSAVPVGPGMDNWRCCSSFGVHDALPTGSSGRAA